MKRTPTPTRSDAAAGAIRWPILLSAASVILILAVVLLFFGNRRSRPVIPKAPDDAVQVVVKGLAEHKPQVLWDALPASYQQDVRDVIAEFCAHMDPDIYDRTFRVLDKMVRVLDEKEDYFANSPVALSVPMLESSIGENWNHDVGILEAIAHSELSSLTTLKQMDPGAFLASTGHKVVAGLDDIRVRSLHTPGLNRWEKMNQELNESRIEFVKTTEGHGYLRFTSPTNSAGKDVELVEVEGRWVPADMAASWEGRITEAREGMAKLSGPEFAKTKPMLNMVLGGLESSMDSLLNAGSQKEFDEKLMGLSAIGGMLRSMREVQNQRTQ